MRSCRGVHGELSPVLFVVLPLAGGRGYLFRLAGGNRIETPTVCIGSDFSGLAGGNRIEGVAHFLVPVRNFRVLGS